ncbi:MAG: regulatory protein RecX [Nitrospirae bacterium]|nr:regulatory protein RecX [Nitrospirota bacterium]
MVKPLPNIKSYVLKLLGMADRSESELRSRLQDKGYEAAAIDETIDQLKDIGIIDDRKTAESILRYCKEQRLLGENGSKHYLKRRGIPDEIIAGIAISTDEQMEKAKKLIGKREKYLKNLPLKVKMNRLYNQLQRKGYGYEIINRAIREYERSCEYEAQVLEKA